MTKPRRTTLSPGLGPALAAFVLSSLLASTALARPQARCQARRSGPRVLVEVIALDDFFDAERLRLVRLGLEGRMAIDVKLVRSRKLWFDEQVVSIPLTLRLGWNAERKEFVVDRSRAVDPAHLRVGPLALPAADTPDGDYRIVIDAKLEVVTASSLGRVASWIAGGDKKGRADDSVVTRNVLSTLTADLAREARGSCKPTKG